MLQALFLSAGLSLGQTGSPLPEPPAPKPSVTIIRAQAAEQALPNSETPVRVVPLYRPEPEPPRRSSGLMSVSYAAPEPPAPAAPLEFSVPGAPVAPAAAAAAAPAAAAVPDRWLLMKSLQGTWAGQALD